MCYQGFATCSCGHTIVHETCCELAANAIFYMKAACPNYSITSTTDSRPCGSGQFYCKETREGHFFEQVFYLAEKTRNQLKQIDNWSAPLDALAAKFTAAANRERVSLTVRQRHPAYNQIFGRLQALEDQRFYVTELYMVALTVLQEGTKYYYARLVHARKGDGSAPPPLSFPENLRSGLPKELQVQLAALAGPSIVVSSGITDDTIDASIHNYDGQSQDDQTQQCLSEGYNTYTTPISREKDRRQILEHQHGSAVSQKLEFSGILTESAKAGRARRTIEQDSTSHPENKTTKRRGSMNKPSLLNEASSIRRSARVRDKKVSYAESEASTIHSREPSPEKSDGGNFSPPKSDISTSPEKRVIRRRPKLADLKREARQPTYSKLSPSNSSLSGLIDEWNRRNIAVNNASSQPQQAATPRSNTAGQTSIQVNYDPSVTNKHSVGSRMPTLTELLNHSPSAAPLALPGGNAGQDLRTVNGPRRPPTAPIHRSSNSSMGMKRLQGMTNYLPSTPGPVPVPSYQYGMHANPPMRMVPPPAHYPSRQLPPPSTHLNVPRNWTITPPDFDNLTEVVTAQAQSNQSQEIGEPIARNDSSHDLVATEETNSTTHSPFTVMNYDRLRRSFSSTAELTPPANLERAMTDTDPTKRSLPASSPLPSRKRMCLSFPREDAINVYESELPFGATGSVSSPSKAPGPDVSANAEGKRHLQNVLDDSLPMMPAPIITPTAVMYLPIAQQSDDGGVRANVLEAGHPNRDEQIAADGTENLSSDIDWGFINEDFL